MFLFKWWLNQEQRAFIVTLLWHLCDFNELPVETMLHRAQNKENKMDFSVAWSVRKMGTDLMSDPSKNAFIMARCETFCDCFFPSAVWVSEWHLRSRQRWSAPTLQSAVSLSQACQKAASFWGLLTAPFIHFFSHQSDSTLKTHLKQKMFHKRDWCGTRSLPLVMLWRENDWLSGTQPLISRGSQPRSTW